MGNAKRRISGLAVDDDPVLESLVDGYTENPLDVSRIGIIADYLEDCGDYKVPFVRALTAMHTAVAALPIPAVQRKPRGYRGRGYFEIGRASSFWPFKKLLRYHVFSTLARALCIRWAYVELAASITWPHSYRVIYPCQQPVKYPARHAHVIDPNAVRALAVTEMASVGLYGPASTVRTRVAEVLRSMPPGGTHRIGYVDQSSANGNCAVYSLLTSGQMLDALIELNRSVCHSLGFRSTSNYTGYTVMAWIDNALMAVANVVDCAQRR